MTPRSTDFAGLLRCLVDGGVEFIVVGAVAGIAHGSARSTFDVDAVYHRSRDNIERLARALAPYSPYLRGAPAGLPFSFDPATIQRGLNFTLTTSLGDLDLLGDIAGGGQYPNLLPRSVVLDFDDLRCRCVRLATLIDLKRAAGRPKDLEAIAELEALLDERQRAGRSDD